MAATSVIGTYYPIKSIIHRIDARIKILIVVATTITLFAVDSFYAFLYLVIFYLFVFFVSDLPFMWIYKAIRPVFTILFIAFFFQVLFTSGEDIYFKWAFFVISKQGLLIGVTVIVRILILVAFTSMLSYTSTPIELTDAIESLLSPLKLVRIPVSDFALVMTIALRFIPQILSESQDLIKAQKARGADFDSKSLLRKGKALLPIFIPLFVTAYRNAEDLSKAMDSRAYNSSQKRTHYKEMRLTNKDFLFLAGSLIIITISLFL